MKNADDVGKMLIAPKNQLVAQPSESDVDDNLEQRLGPNDEAPIENEIFGIILKGPTAMAEYLNNHLLSMTGSVYAVESVLNNFGESPLVRAIELRQFKTAEVLLDHGAYADQGRSRHDGSTPLMLAIKSNQIALVKKLIQGGANITATNYKGETAAELAKSLRLQRIENLINQSQPNTNTGSPRTITHGWRLKPDSKNLFGEPDSDDDNDEIVKNGYPYKKQKMDQ